MTEFGYNSIININKGDLNMATLYSKQALELAKKTTDYTKIDIFTGDVIFHMIASAAKEHGKIRLCDGVFIETAENLTEDQKNWDDLDNCKHNDFSYSKLWLTTNAGTDPEAVSCWADIEESIY
jgi:hypothetical protein